MHGPESGERDPAEREVGYAEWRCTECGHGHPKNTPPCDRCGHLAFSRVEVSASDFDDEIAGLGTLALLRENSLPAIAAMVVVVAAVGLVATGSGAVVLSDPFGWGYKWGVVEATNPAGDTTFTAGDMRTELEGDLAVESMAWRGEGLELVYRSDAATSTALGQEIETIATTYARYVADGGGADRLTIVVQVGQGRAGDLTVRRQWAVAVNGGDMSRDEYLRRIFETARK